MKSNGMHNPYEGLNGQERWKACRKGLIRPAQFGFFFERDPMLSSSSNILFLNFSKAMDKFYPMFLRKHFSGQLDCVRDGDQAVEALKEHEHDLIITRLNCPLSSSIQRIQDSGYKGIILAYTAAHQDGVLATIAQLGLHGYISQREHDLDALAYLLKLKKAA